MKIFTLLFLFLVTNSFLFSQIESGKKKGKKNKQAVESSKPVEMEQKTIVSLNYARGNSFRTLQQNGDFYGDSLGERSNETAQATSGVYLTLNNPINKNLFLDFGIGFQQFGERYSKDLLDSTISYENKYSNLVLPLKIQFKKGKDFQFFVSTGFQAQLALAFTNEFTTTKDNASNTTKTEITYNKNSFSIASTSSLGFQMRFSPKSCLIVSGDFIRQLSSSYNSQASYIHKPYFYGFKVGLGFKL
jgi:hypothetical protein